MPPTKMTSSAAATAGRNRRGAVAAGNMDDSQGKYVHKVHKKTPEDEALIRKGLEKSPIFANFEAKLLSDIMAALEPHKVRVSVTWVNNEKGRRNWWECFSTAGKSEPTRACAGLCFVSLLELNLCLFDIQSISMCRDLLYLRLESSLLDSTARKHFAYSCMSRSMLWRWCIVSPLGVFVRFA